MEGYIIKKRGKPLISLDTYLDQEAYDVYQG